MSEAKQSWGPDKVQKSELTITVRDDDGLMPEPRVGQTLTLKSKSVSGQFVVIGVGEAQPDGWRDLRVRRVAFSKGGQC